MKNAMMVATLCATILSVSGQTSDIEKTTCDSIAEGTRVPAFDHAALDQPILLSLAPQKKINGFLVVSTLYGQPVNVDEGGFDPEKTFKEAGRVTYATIEIGTPILLTEERCFAFQYWDTEKNEVNGKATTLCLTQDFVDLQFEDGDAYMDGEVAVITRPLKTARDKDVTLHSTWIREFRNK